MIFEENSRTPQVLLTIAGFDPSSGAGVTADLAVIQAHGFFGTACITALTVQSTRGVFGSQTAGAAQVVETLRRLQEDLPPAGVKLGMLADAAIARVVAEFVTSLPDRVPVVLDPVLRSTSGHALLEQEGIAVVVESLLPRVTWITPNTTELSLLAGLPAETPEDVQDACAALLRRFPRLSVAATGGHLPEPHDCLVMPGRAPVWLPGTRLHTRATHGTGCAFSTALLCGLVRGQSGESAAADAKHFVTEAMRRAPEIGAGHGPMNLLWPLREH